MPEDYVNCPHLGRFTNIENEMRSIKDQVTGKEGLLVVVTKQVEITERLSKSVDQLFGVVQTLNNKEIKEEAQQEVIQKISNEKKQYKRFFITTIIALLVVLLGSATLYFKIRKDQKINSEQIVLEENNNK